MMPKFLAPALRILVTALLILLAIHYVDATKVSEALGRMEVGHLALLLVASWIGQLACAQRWRLFALSLGMKGSYFTFLKMYFVGMIFNAGLPSLVGGDVVKAYLVSRRAACHFKYGLASVLLDRAAGLISLLAYGSAAVLLVPLTWRGIPLWFVYLIIWAGVLSGLALAWKGERIYQPWLNPKSKSWFQKIFQLISDFHQALLQMRLSRGTALQICAISMFNSGLVLWVFQQVSVAFNQPVGLLGFSVLFPVISVITLLPVSIHGLGLREWAYVEGLALLNIPPELALTLALASSALMIVTDLAGVFFLPTMPIRSREIR
jgi:glycosyltransferase 2 family protein